MADLNAVSVGILDLVHGQPLETDYFRGVSPLLVRLSQDEHIANQHSEDRPDVALDTDLALKRALYLAEKVGFWVAVAPNVEVKTGVVALEEFLMAHDPLTELCEGEAGLGGSTCQF